MCGARGGGGALCVGLGEGRRRCTVCGAGGSGGALCVGLGEEEV